MKSSVMARQFASLGRSRIGAVCVSLAFAALSYWFNKDQVPLDFYALYLAASNFAAGAFDQVYAAPHAYFNLAAPEAWAAQAAALGIETDLLYPFIYPPLWAALFAPVTMISGPGAMAQVGFVLNPLLLAACCWLAYRIVQPRIGVMTWQVLGLLFVGGTAFGAVALYQNQPQILVSFLILLALERDRSNAPVAAGLAMALAASIKLYPALFALMWVVTGNRRAFASFVVFGAGLGGASVLVAGWPLHTEFLGWIKTISGTLITSSLTWTVDATITQYLFADHMRGLAEAAAQGGAPASNVFLGTKPGSLALLDKALLIGVLLLGARAMVRARSDDDRFRQVWPGLIVAVSLVSPLSWSYHYITAAVFVPVLLTRMGKIGALHIGLIYAGTGIPTMILAEGAIPGLLLEQLLGTGAVLYMLLVLTWPAQADRAALQGKMAPLSA